MKIRFDSEKKSATLQLLFFRDKIYKNNDARATGHLAFLYLDFAKAFDTVPHAQLIKITCNLRKWWQPSETHRILLLRVATICHNH